MAPSEALLAGVGEAFEASVPTRPVAHGSANLRQTHMAGGTDTEATPLPPPRAFSWFATPGAGVPRKSGAVPIAGAPEPAPSPFDLPKPVFRQTLIGGLQAPTLPSPNLAQGRPAYPTFQPAPGMPGAGLPAPSFPGAAFPGAPVPLHAPQTYSSHADMYPAEVVSLRAPSRLKYYVIFVLCMLGGGGGVVIFMTGPADM